MYFSISINNNFRRHVTLSNKTSNLELERHFTVQKLAKKVKYDKKIFQKLAEFSRKSKKKNLDLFLEKPDLCIIMK